VGWQFSFVYFFIFTSARPLLADSAGLSRTFSRKRNELTGHATDQRTNLAWPPHYDPRYANESQFFHADGLMEFFMERKNCVTDVNSRLTAVVSFLSTSLTTGERPTQKKIKKNQDPQKKRTK